MDDLKADQVLFIFPLHLLNLHGVLKDERVFISFCVGQSKRGMLILKGLRPICVFSVVLKKRAATLYILCSCIHQHVDMSCY